MFFICIHREQKLQLFLNDLEAIPISNLHMSLIKNTSFLELNVSLCDRKLTTYLHVKPTDRNQYLNYTSAHPNHTKYSIVYSQALRLFRTCSYKNNVEKTSWGDEAMVPG